ncbi:MULTISPECIES: hypothetical protein [Pirellulaceae]|nr:MULTISPECIES: hypothetical protein [Pirellulaceae]
MNQWLKARKQKEIMKELSEWQRNFLTKIIGKTGNRYQWVAKESGE